MSARSKAWVCVHSIVGIVGLNPSGGHEFLSIVSVVSCQVEVSASGLSRGVLPYVARAMIALAKPPKKEEAVTENRVETPQEKQNASCRPGN
jgi:hypothetical protein